MALSENDALVSSDGLVAHALYDGLNDFMGIYPASGTSAEQFRFIEGMVKAWRATEQAGALTMAIRVATSTLAYIYRNQSAADTTGNFRPQYLVGVRHAFTLANGETVNPGDAFRTAPSEALLADLGIDADNGAYPFAVSAFAALASATGDQSWTMGTDASRREVLASLQFSGLPWTPGAVPVISQYDPEDNGWRPPAYAGNQVASSWAELGATAQLANVLTFLEATQAAWISQTGKDPGLFMPVFYFDTPGSTAYGPANSYGFNGPIDGNTMLNQLNAMRDVLWAAAKTTDATLKSRAYNIGSAAFNWFADESHWLPSRPEISDKWNDVIRGSSLLINTADTDATLPVYWFCLPERLTDTGDFWSSDLPYMSQFVIPLADQWVTVIRKSALLEFASMDEAVAESTLEYPMAWNPGLTAMAMESAIILDGLERPNGDGTVSLRIKRVLDRCIQMFDFTYQETGAMAGTFSPDPENRVWYGRWHGELLNGIYALYAWSLQPNNNYPVLTERALKWLGGLISSADGLSEDSAGGLIYGRTLWPLAPDWVEGVGEAFEYSTQIITSDGGDEQRLSQRVKPRRTLSYRHTLLTQEDAAQYQAILRKRQNRPTLVPQWHLSITVSQKAMTGDDVIYLTRDADAEWGSAKALYLVSGETLSLLNILRVSGRTVYLRDVLPMDVAAGAELMTVQYGLINNDLSSTRAISTVLQAQIAFLMLPQTDTRHIPEMTTEYDLAEFITEQGFRWSYYIRRCAILDPVHWPTWPAPEYNYTSRKTFTLNGDTRMVITRKPNWISAVTVQDQWDYDMINYLNSAVTPEYGYDAGRRTMQAQWNAFSYDETNDILSVFGALRGMQVACWIPSWSHDLKMVANMTALNRIRVEYNAVIEEEILLDDPTIALYIELQDGSAYCAAVSAITTIQDESVLTLDRDLGTLLTMTRVVKISLMYRVRMASDTLDLTWRAKGLSEMQSSFITVQR